MYQKKFIKIICFLFCFVVTGSYNQIIIGAATPSPFTNPAGPADIDFMNDPEFVKMLEEFERELANLSPEERQAFDEMVDEFARVIEQMPPEEFEDLLKDMNRDFEMAETANLAADIVPKEPIPAPVIQIAIPDEIKLLAENLQRIKTYLSVFLVKIQIAPEFSLKIDNWIRRGKIKNFSTGYTWDQCSQEIEKFCILISHLLLTDKKMNPVFLFEIHKDQGLEKIISNFADQLTVIPSIDIVEFGFKQEKETNMQIQEVISHIGETFFKEDIMNKLELIFKARQSEIDAKQLEAVAKNRTEPAPYNLPSYTQPATRQDYYEDSGYYDNASGRRDFYDDYDQYYPSYSSGGRYGSSSNYGFGGEEGEKSGKSGKSGRIGGRGKGGTGEGEREKKEKEEKSEKKGEKEEKKKDRKTVQKELQKQISEIISLIETVNLDTFEEYLQDNKIQFIIQKTLNNAEKLDEKAKKAAKNTSELIKLIEEEKRPEKITEEIKDKLASDIEKIDELNQKLYSLIAQKDSYSLEKRAGYFDDIEALEKIKKQNPRKAKEIEDNQEKFVSITILSKNFNKLVSALKPFSKEKEKEKEEVTKETKEPETGEVETGQGVEPKKEKTVEPAVFLPNTPGELGASVKIPVQETKPVTPEEKN